MLGFQMCSCKILHAFEISPKATGCLYAATSNVSLKLSDISFNQAFAGGAAIIYSNSDFIALKTKFCNNTAVTNGGAIYQRQSGHTALDQCSFRYNRVDDAYSIYGSDIRRMEGHDVRISQCEWTHSIRSVFL